MSAFFVFVEPIAPLFLVIVSPTSFRALTCSGGIAGQYFSWATSGIIPWLRPGEHGVLGQSDCP